MWCMKPSSPSLPTSGLNWFRLLPFMARSGRDGGRGSWALIFHNQWLFYSNTFWLYCDKYNCTNHSTPRMQINVHASHRQGKVLPYIEKIGTKIRKLGEKKERLKGQGGYALATIRRWLIEFSVIGKSGTSIRFCVLGSNLIKEEYQNKF